ncbi:hypothetical protein AAFC00_002732 [Neodothiora populina]|uniref:Uncharacterized protein n=1 Tax=Neodothiora populina TaxID=2781224 RepID=A0ABR3P874_9PEZI
MSGPSHSMNSEGDGQDGDYWLDLERLVSRILDYNISGSMIARDLTPDEFAAVKRDFTTVILALQKISKSLGGRDRPGGEEANRANGLLIRSRY